MLHWSSHEAKREVEIGAHKAQMHQFSMNIAVTQNDIEAKGNPSSTS